MQTRSRKTSEAIGEVTDAIPKVKPGKNTKRAKSTSSEEVATPSKVQKADALVENVLKSVQKPKSPIATPSENGNQLKGNDKLTASEKTQVPKVANRSVSKVIRGQPKSGRPWKGVKQK